MLNIIWTAVYMVIILAILSVNHFSCKEQQPYLDLILSCITASMRYYKIYWTRFQLLGGRYMWRRRNLYEKPYSHKHATGRPRCGLRLWPVRHKTSAKLGMNRPLMVIFSLDSWLFSLLWLFNLEDWSAMIWLVGPPDHLLCLVSFFISILSSKNNFNLTCYHLSLWKSE